MNKKLVLINNTTLESLEEVDVLKIVEKFTKTGMEVLSADFGFMFWKLKNQDKYQIMYVSPETPYKPKLPRKRGYNYTASKGRIPYFVSSPIKDLLPYMKSLAIVPIFYKSYQYGNIVLCFNKRRTFTPEEKPLLMNLGNSAAHVLTIHRANQRDKNVSIKLLKEKDEFFNIASHELKTPVAAIKGFVQILNQKLKKVEPETKYFLGKINNHTDKLSRLVNDLLDVSRIERGKLKFKKSTFELSELLQEVADEVRAALPKNSITFKNTGRFWVIGDSEHIERVIINLLTNAAKYSPMGSKIKVNLEKRSGKALVNIEDFGIGIAKRDQSKIFNRFFQSKNNSLTSKLPGLGLGLYISKEILKHHGGGLALKTKTRGKGSIFSFTLPYQKFEPNQK